MNDVEYVGVCVRLLRVGVAKIVYDVDLAQVRVHVCTLRAYFLSIGLFV